MLSARKAAEVPAPLVSLEYARKPKRQGKITSFHLLTSVGCSDLTDHLLHVALGGGAREHKDNLLVTIIYVRHHSGNVQENSLAQAGFALTNTTVSVSSPY